MRRNLAIISGVFIVSLLSFQARSAVIADNAAVSSSERLSTAAGLNVLRSGGTAADAAVTIAFTLAVLRPDVAGVGGGGTVLYYDAGTGEVWALDFRATPGNPTYLEGVSPDAIVPLGVPGFVAGLGELHRKFGEQKWPELLKPSIALAAEAPDGDSLSTKIDQELTVRPVERPAWIESGESPPLGQLLQRIASRGPEEPYLGETAKRLVARSKEIGGALSPRALAEYVPRWRSPLRIDFRSDQVYSLPSPAGGGNALAEMIAILSGFEWHEMKAGEPRVVHLFLEAERQAWTASRRLSAERGTVARPETSDARRLSEIRTSIEAGTLDQDVPQMASRKQMVGFTVIDDRRNAAVVTLSLGSPFGSGHLVDESYYIAEVSDENPSSLSVPMMVLRDGKARMGLVVSGSETASLVGAQIYLLEALLGVSVEEAIRLPRFVPAEQPRTVMCERGTDFEDIDGLNRLGHGVTWNDSIGIVQVIGADDSIVTVSDPRGGTAGGY